MPKVDKKKPKVGNNKQEAEKKKTKIEKVLDSKKS